VFRLLRDVVKGAHATATVKVSSLCISSIFSYITAHVLIVGVCVETSIDIAMLVLLHGETA